MRQEAKRRMRREHRGERGAQGIAVLPGCLFSRQDAKGAKGSLVTPVGDRETAFSKKRGRGENPGLLGPFGRAKSARNALVQRGIAWGSACVEKARMWGVGTGGLGAPDQALEDKSSDCRFKNGSGRELEGLMVFVAKGWLCIPSF